MAKILIIDDEEQLRKLLARIIGLEGYEVAEAADCAEGLRMLRRCEPDVVLCDVKLPDGNGVEMVGRIKQAVPSAEVILLTAYGNIPDGVQAIKNGAFDYITKGDDNNKILPLLSRAAEKAEMQRRLTRIENKLSEEHSFDRIVGDSEVLRRAVDLARKVAVTGTSVLLTGETGTGKELVASSLHNASYRKAKPFVAVNCAALPESILEGLLFGSRKGAFTGAENRKGLFQEADGGTLYLDEINSMPLNLQAKLLRVLQEKQVMPLGSTQPIAVDVRIVSSSNCPPDELVRNGELRPDLLYRLNTVTLAIPPLNQRPDDIPLLSEYFLYKYSRVLGRPVPQMAQETILFLSNCRWHGNVRELEHAIEAALNVLGEGSVLSLEHLPAYLTMREPPEIHQKNTEPTLSLPETMGLYEKKLILQALMSCGGKIVEAAALLQIPRTTLQYKIRKYGLMIE